METLPDKAAQPAPLTPERAEAYGTLMDRAKPLVDAYFAHVERVNDQQRVATKPIYWIVGSIIVAGSIAALVAAFNGNEQLARELLPLLSFAGGLGIGRSVTPKA